MSEPTNPHNIILKNQFFPDGLTEKEIYNYWVKNKSNILKNLMFSKQVMFFLSPAENEYVIRRYQKSNLKTYYILSEENYEKILNGRIVGIVNIFQPKSNWGVIDIDYNGKNDIANENEFNQIKQLTAQLYDFFIRYYPIKIFYSGKNGFHLICQFEKKIKIDQIKNILKNQLSSTSLSILQRSNSFTCVKIDLSPNMVNGGVITPYSLNKIGLPSIPVKMDKLLNFNRSELISVVKKV